MGDSIIEKHISKLEAEGLATSNTKRNRFFLRCLKELLAIGEVRRVCKDRRYPRSSLRDLALQYRTSILFPSNVCIWAETNLSEKFWVIFEEEFLDYYIKFLNPQALNLRPQGT